MQHPTNIREIEMNNAPKEEREGVDPTSYNRYRKGITLLAMMSTLFLTGCWWLTTDEVLLDTIRTDFTAFAGLFSQQAATAATVPATVTTGPQT